MTQILNKYIGLLPTIKNSQQAVASTELGNVPFNETTLASIILNHLPAAWRTQYALTHTLVPESPRAILLDLENIEKLFVEKTNEAARANKAKVATALKGAGEHVPRKGKRTHGGRSNNGTPKKGRTVKYANGASVLTGRSRLTTPTSAVGSTRTAVRRVLQISPLTPQRSPGRNQAVGIPTR